MPDGADGVLPPMAERVQAVGVAKATEQTDVVVRVAADDRHTLTGLDALRARESTITAHLSEDAGEAGAMDERSPRVAADK